MEGIGLTLCAWILQSLLTSAAGPKFNIAERSKRDEKAKRLADEASKRMRLEKAAKQPKRPGSLASPISTPRSSKSLTPSPSTRSA